MLVLLSVSLIYAAGWMTSLWYWYSPDFILLLILCVAHMAYGLVCFRIDYIRWGDRFLWGLSFVLLLYSYVHHWQHYQTIIGPHAEFYRLLFVAVIVIATPTLAVAGPVRTAILGVRQGRDDNQGHSASRTDTEDEF